MNSSSGTSPDPRFLIAASGEKCMLRLRGEIDVTNVAGIEAELRRLTSEHPLKLVLDLQEVSFLDSAGIRLVLQAHRWQNEAGNTLTVVPGAGVV